MNYQFYMHFEIKIHILNQVWGTSFIPDGFEKFCFRKSFTIFFSIDVCGNGYLRNIVTTSLFMTLI